MSLTGTLRAHKLFEALTDAELAQISRFSSVVQFRPGEIIYRHDSPAENVFLTLGGVIHLTLPAMSKDFGLLISKVGKGEVFGVASLLGGERHTAIATTVDAAEVMCIPAQPFLAILMANYQAGFHVVRHVARVYLDRYTEVMRNLQAMVSHIPLSR
jgi:signal-transduction protein with cAMP-binding, CBS, and nucleotidyltransferase domain